MIRLGPGEVARLARLARVELSSEEAGALAPQLEGIAGEFEGLRAFAASLPEAEAGVAGGVRSDEVAAVVDTAPILAQVPRRDASGRIRVERA